jgi:hypothetical protein
MGLGMAQLDRDSGVLGTPADGSEELLKVEGQP